MFYEGCCCVSFMSEVLPVGLVGVFSLISKKPADNLVSLPIDGCAKSLDIKPYLCSGLAEVLLMGKGVNYRFTVISHTFILLQKWRPLQSSDSSRVCMRLSSTGLSFDN